MPKIYKNTASRLASVQLLYSFETSGGQEIYELEDFDKKIIKGLSQYNNLGAEESYGLDDDKPNKKFVLKLIQAIVAEREKIDHMIEENLDKVDSLKHMNVLMISSLRCAVAELLYFDTPYKIVIKEYIKISSTFFSDAEVSFINGILDKIAKTTK